MSLKCELVYYISYARLFGYLDSKGLGAIYLYNCVSPATVAKLRKNKVVRTDVIVKICRFLNVQPGDIMEYRCSGRLVEVVANE